jgi:phosphatidylserine synthase
VFGIKDIFTTVNLMGGVVGICLCIDGQPYAAGLAILIGYAVGDTLDGWVARKLDSANEFGAEYDTISDHLAHVIAPAAVVYTVYRDAGLVAAPFDQVLAIALAGSIVVAASVRHARNVVQPVRYRGVWAGLPRTVLGFLAVAYVNAGLAPHLPGGWWLGVVLIPGISLATLTHLPFPNHHLSRGHPAWIRLLVGSFFVATPAAAALAPAFLFDVLFFFMVGYSLTAWMSLTPSERVEFRVAVRSAAREPTT